ncbi:Small-conductance mechanosensitive channel [Rhizobiales bacterium GAS113]|nr:Small-conductance mechanosensitive channel [Rhizobiales bacterium GAS113]SED10138.1 Small-conductance mechanosensitive channel [Rhizobiales bacterium GAS188]
MAPRLPFMPNQTRPRNRGARAGALALSLTLALIAGLLLPGPGLAQAPPSAAPAASDQAPDPEIARQQAQLDGIKRELDQIEQSLNDPKLDDGRLTDLRDRLEPAAQQLTAFIAAISPRVTDLNQRVAQLAPKAATEKPEPDKTGAAKADPNALAPAAPPAAPAAPDTPDVSRMRETLTAARDAAVGLLNTANSLQVQAVQLANRIADRRRANFTEKILERSPSIIAPPLWEAVVSSAPSVASSLWQTVTSWIGSLPGRLTAQTSLELAIVGLFAFVAVGPGRRFAYRLIRRTEERRPPSTLGIALGAVILAIAGVVLPLLAVAALTEVMDEINFAPRRLMSLIRAILYAPALLLAGRAVVHAVLAPGVSRLRLLPASDSGAFKILRLVSLAILVWAVAAISEAAVRSVYAPVNLSVAIKGLAALALSALLITALRGAAQADAEAEAACLGPYVDPGGRLGGLARILGWICATTLGIAALLGYNALAWFLGQQILWAGALFAIATMVVALIDALAAQMRRHDTAVSRFAHLQMGLPERALEQAGALVGGVLKAVTIVLALLLLLAPWGVESGGLAEALQAVIFGFSVGGVTMSLSSLVIAAMLFAAGIFVTRILQNWLETEFLPTTQIDAGLRNSIRTAAGYLGSFVAAALALSALGLSVDRLAIVAGALSVGIGFGLQSIVNNFVSGLILLWERPIRVGDWVVVGAEEGIVRRINVRATEIETFDRTAVIVPNSTFISGIVKNKVLSDRSGRVNMVVTVATTEDPEKVRDLLFLATRTHPEILREPAPVVQLKNFSAAGIDFELFGFVADVNQTGRISSELRFSILKRLREAEITLPTANPALTTQQLETAFANLARSIEEGRMEGETARGVPKRATASGRT